MDFIIDLILFGVLVIGMTAFLDSIGRLIVSPFMRRKVDLYTDQTRRIKAGWKKVGGQEQG